MIKKIYSLKRMACQNSINLSFGQAFLLGLSGGQIPTFKNTIKYNGSGIAGDFEAIGQDLKVSIKSQAAIYTK